MGAALFESNKQYVRMIQQLLMCCMGAVSVWGVSFTFIVSGQVCAKAESD